MSEDSPPEEEQPNPIRRTLDLLFFAPLGAAVTAAEDLPAMVAKGRTHLENHVRNARVIGQFVVTQGQQDLTQRVNRLLHGDAEATPPASGAPEPTGDVGATTTGESPLPDPEAPAAPMTPAAAEESDGDGGHETNHAPRASQPAADPADGAIVEQALAGYDTLSASQVVRRLESLGPDELRAIQRHEASHRNRRTILNRAGQLLEEERAPATSNVPGNDSAGEPASGPGQ